MRTIFYQSINKCFGLQKIFFDFIINLGSTSTIEILMNSTTRKIAYQAVDDATELDYDKLFLRSLVRPRKRRATVGSIDTISYARNYCLYALLICYFSHRVV